MPRCRGKQCEWFIENVGEQGECDCIRKTLYDLDCVYTKPKQKKYNTDLIRRSK